MMECESVQIPQVKIVHMEAPLVSAPFSGYAHIHDSVIVSSVSNANYDNLIASDRFLEMSDGICTKEFLM